MRIGIYANWSVKVSSQGFFVLGIHKKYLEAFCERGTSVTLLSNTSAVKPSSYDEFVDIQDVKLIQLPRFTNYIGAVRFYKEIVAGIRSLLELSDFVYIRSPEPFAWAFSLLGNGKAVLHYHFVSNPFDVIFSQRHSSLPVRVGKAAIYYPEYILNAFAASKHRYSCNGPAMVAQLPPFLRRRIKVLVESSLVDSDFSATQPPRPNSGLGIRLLCVGRIQPGKGVDTLLNACKLLLMEKPDIEFSLTIVGSGTDSERIKLISAELGIENQVTFLGEVKNGAPLNAIYSSHDVFIMPSLSETGPRVILEAMAQNLFCVATDVGYVSLLLGNKNDIGLLVEPGSEAAIKDALIWCYENKQETVEMASRARTQVSNYTLNNFVSGVIGS